MDERCELLCLDLDRAEEIRARLLGQAQAAVSAERARALADPTRLVLASALADGDELCVCDLSWIAARSQGLVSHHLRTLRTAGLVRSRRHGKMVLYQLTDTGQELLASLIPHTTAAPC
jgi:DNA-binding transcriptional ArsR family regulator